MSEQLPRPIKPEEIKAGMRVRLTITDDDVTRSYEGVASDGWNKSGECVKIGERQVVYDEPGCTWELLAEAPTLALAVGSRFATSDGAKWIVYDSDRTEAFCYESGKRYTADAGTVRVAELANYRGPLVPIPDHGDGCSPWLWDRETDTGWVACEPDGEGTTHRQVSGTRYNWGYLATWAGSDDRIAGRLRPWSERGQANG